MAEMLFYTRFAPYYDRIYQYIDFEKQADFFVKLIEKFNKSGNNKILDAACGTGINAELLQKKGFEVVGLDKSKEMLEEAKKKDSEIKFIRDDMKEFRLDEKFAVVICFFNSILYNKNREEMKKALSNFYSHLEKGGILVFDAVDKSIGIGSEKGEYKYESSDLKILFKPQWVYRQSEGVLYLKIDFEVNGKKMHDAHLMGAFTLNELESMLKEVGFDVFIFEREFEEMKEFKSGKKAIFVCRK